MYKTYILSAKLTIIQFLFATTNTFSQATSITNVPEINKLCPNFTLNEVVDYSSPELSLLDFKGKAIILDFFTTGCTACFASLPKLKLLSEEFKGKVQFVLIGYKDKYIREAYQKYKNKYGLNFPVAFDVQIFKNFEIPGVPYIIWIDANGEIKAISSSVDLLRENINSFINNKSFNYIDVSVQAKLNEQESTKLKDQDNLDSNLIFSSKLERWTAVNGQTIPYKIEEEIKMLEVKGSTLNWLYNLAYLGYSNIWYGDSLYGNVSPNPILIMSDSSKFIYDFPKCRNIFSYFLKVPLNPLKSLDVQKIIQQDLQDCFGYSAKVELRETPYWKLVATESAKNGLVTNGIDLPLTASTPFSKIYSKYLPTGIELKNRPLDLLLRAIWAHNQDEPPFINETGISENVDLKFDAIMADMGDIKSALKELGLELIKGYKKMRVVVIYNSNQIYSLKK